MGIRSIIIGRQSNDECKKETDIMERAAWACADKKLRAPGLDSGKRDHILRSIIKQLPASCLALFFNSAHVSQTCRLLV